MTIPKSAVLLVTGPPMSGQTDLVANLARHGFTPVAPGDFFVDPLWEVLFRVHQRPGRAAFNGLHLQATLQGVLDGSGDPLGTVGRRMVERYLLARRAVAVVCLPPYEEVLARWEATGRAEPDLYPLYYAWDSLRVFQTRQMVQTDLPVVIHTDRDKDLGPLLEKVREARPPHNQGPGIGHYQEGATLLVTDRPRDSHPLGLPFVDDQGAGPWFTEHLEEAGIPETGLYWVPNREPDGRETDPHFLQDLQPERVVAVGSEALRWTKRQGLQAHALPCPNYWRKVQRHRPYPLQEAFQ